MSPLFISSHLESIEGGRKEPLIAPADAVMQFKIGHEFRGAKAGDLNLVLFNTTYTIGAPSIDNPANFHLVVVHASRFKIDSPLTDELGRDSDFHARLIELAGPVAQARVSELLSAFGLNTEVPISRPPERQHKFPKEPTKMASKRKQARA